MSKYHYTGPSIDHTGLSPSGRASKRAREAWGRIQDARLFPPGFWDVAPKSDAQLCDERAATLRRSAANLRALADRGMTPRKFAREAARLDAEADALSRAQEAVGK